MSDIVDRLRADYFSMVNDPAFVIDRKDVLAAADEIERLRMEIERFKKTADIERWISRRIINAERPDPRSR